jgi:hypothetical protein
MTAVFVAWAELLFADAVIPLGCVGSGAVWLGLTAFFVAFADWPFAEAPIALPCPAAKGRSLFACRAAPGA